MFAKGNAGDTKEAKFHAFCLGAWRRRVKGK